MSVVRMLAVSALVLFFSSDSIVAQEQSSRRENEIAKAIEAAGGRVYRISAADTAREVSFALSDKPVSDEHLKDLGGLGEVIWLNLANTKITNDGLKHLKGLPLKKLHLEKTGIGDEGLKHVKGFKDLEYLNLYATKVSDAGLKHLVGLKNLKKLYVWQSKVTEDGMKTLNKTLPDLEIIGEVKLTPVVIEEPKKKADEKAKPAEDKSKKTDKAKKTRRRKEDNW